MDKIIEILKSIFYKIKSFFKKIKGKTKVGIKKLKEKQIPKKVKNKTIKTIAIIGTVTGGLIKRNLDVNKELERAKEEQEKIEKNLDNETDIVVIKMYKKDVAKTIKRLDKIDNTKNKEEQKNIDETKKEIKKLEEKIIKIEAKLNEEINILDVKKEETKDIENENIQNDEIVQEQKIEVIIENKEIIDKEDKEKIDKIEEIKPVGIVEIQEIDEISNNIPKEQEEIIEPDDIQEEQKETIESDNVQEVKEKEIPLKEENNNEKPINKVEEIKEKNTKETNKIKETSKKVGQALKKGSIKTGKIIKKGTVKTAKVVGNTSKKVGAIVAGSVGTVVSNIANNVKTKKSKKQEFKELKNTIKEINLKINRAYKEISKIKNNYSDTKLQELQLVKEKVLDLKEDYIRLRSHKNFKSLKLDKNIDNIDPNHLSHHGNALYDLIDYVELSINEVKEGIITSEPVVKKEVKEETKKEEKKKIGIEKTITFDKNDFILVKESIEKDINTSLNDVVKIKNEINDIPFKYKKSRLLNRVCGFFRFSMNTAISLIPFGIFRNKYVATLTSGIILNNRIKSMKSLVYDKRVEFIDYENIINNINDKNSCLTNTSFVLLDTVKHIDDVNNKLLEEYPNNQEALKLVKNLEEMKLDLLEENVKIETMLEDLEKSKNKVKTKVA